MAALLTGVLGSRGRRRRTLCCLGCALIAGGLSACGATPARDTVQRDLPAASKEAEGRHLFVTVDDGGESKTLEYVQQGGHWVLHGCRKPLRNGISPKCTAPSDAPETTDG
jgi:hypothetical protein